MRLKMLRRIDACRQTIDHVSTTTAYYIKTGADDIEHAMEKLESNIPQAPAVRDT